MTPVCIHESKMLLNRKTRLAEVAEITGFAYVFYARRIQACFYYVQCPWIKLLKYLSN